MTSPKPLTSATKSTADSSKTTGDGSPSSNSNGRPRAQAVSRSAVTLAPRKCETSWASGSSATHRWRNANTASSKMATAAFAGQRESLVWVSADEQLTRTGGPRRCCPRQPYRSECRRQLLKGLQEVRADEQVTAILALPPAAEMFGLFQKYLGSRYRFGRNPSGHPAEPRGWDDRD